MRAVTDRRHRPSSKPIRPKRYESSSNLGMLEHFCVLNKKCHQVLCEWYRLSLNADQATGRGPRFVTHWRSKRGLLIKRRAITVFRHTTATAIKRWIQVLSRRLISEQTIDAFSNQQRRTDGRAGRVGTTRQTKCLQKINYFFSLSVRRCGLLLKLLEE